MKKISEADLKKIMQDLGAGNAGTAMLFKEVEGREVYFTPRGEFFYTKQRVNEFFKLFSLEQIVFIPDNGREGYKPKQEVLIE